jgi:hypothetical protein
MPNIVITDRDQVGGQINGEAVLDDSGAGDHEPRAPALVQHVLDEGVVHRGALQAAVSCTPSASGQGWPVDDAVRDSTSTIR